MPDPLPLLDPLAADSLAGGRLDPGRAVCVPSPDPTRVALGLAALANTRGGDLILGARMGADGVVAEAGGIARGTAEATLTDALALIDPPITHLVRTRAIDAPEGLLLVVHVRLSPSSPHVVTETGVIPRLIASGPAPVRSRRELDALYARGRGERERADRLVDAMIEKLSLAHYAFYTLAVIACTHTPSAEPYRAAVEGGIAPPDDPFIRAHELNPEHARVWTGEIEMRTPGDTGAYIRVTRSGCVAAGEIQRRPYHEELGTAPELRARIEALAATTCRLLGQAADAVMVPHLFVEGIRGLRLVLDPAARKTSGHAPQDTARYALPLGDARDPSYPARLADEAISQFQALFPLPS